MTLGVCYYPEHWPEDWWAEDARRMRELGIEYVRIGEFSWSRLEPKRDDFRWEWLDRAMETLGSAGLKIVLCTPTATPPKWLMDEYPEIAPTDEHGRRRGFGSRRHYSFSSAVYARESARIVEALASRYGRYAALAGWQTDNEYGCHDTVLSWGAEDQKAFREWLRRRHQSPSELNAAWGNVFWSMELNSFDEVAAPNLTVTEASPAARLDYRRFASAQVKAFDRLQVDIIRKYSPGRWVTHNFMGFFNAFDHWDLGDNLDFASWDSYPIGFTEKFPFSEAEHARWQDTAHPDVAPFHHDLYRGVGRGRFWVMEQQPGPVNWAPYNPVPAPGMVKLWAIEAHAHGADVCSYFRWRQAPFAQEQMHAGLNLPNGHELSPGGHEAKAAAKDLARLGELPATNRAPVALVYDYEGIWATQIQPQGASFNAVELIFRWYEAIRRLGVDVDFVRPGASLQSYELILVPCLPIVSDSAERALAAATGVVVFGPRAGSRTREFSIPDNLPPGPLANLIAMRVIEVSSMRPGIRVGVSGAISGAAERWREHIEAQGETLACFEDGAPALVANGRRLYAGFWPDAEALASLMTFATLRAGLETHALPEPIRIRRRGDLLFVFNYGGEAWSVPSFAGQSLFGAREAPPHGYAVFRQEPRR